MNKIFSFRQLALIGLLIIVSCSNVDKIKSITADSKDSETAKKELDSKFKIIWGNVTLTNATKYFKTDVSDNFFTLNADGIVQNKAEVLADTKRLEMLEILNF
jgi:hypothetical protein